MDEIYVTDLRADDDSSLAIVPRCTTWQDVLTYFKLRHLTAYGWDATPDGKACWKLVGCYVRTGVAEYIPKVLGEDGQPYWNVPTNTGAVVVRSWPGADDFPTADPIRPDYNALAGCRPHSGVAGWTNANGDAGFAYGGGSVTGPDGGPDVIWVHAAPTGQEPQYGDAVAGLGWIGGTDHLTANPVFQLVRKSGGVTPPAPTGRYLLVYQNGQIVMHIPAYEGTPPAGFSGLAWAMDVQSWFIGAMPGEPG